MLPINNNVPLFASRPSNSGSQRPLGLRCGIFPTSRTLESNLRITFKEEMSVCVFSEFLLSRLLVHKRLTTGRPQVQEILPKVYEQDS
jgi:hypothetical protein